MLLPRPFSYGKDVFNEHAAWKTYNTSEPEYKPLEPEENFLMNKKITLMNHVMTNGPIRVKHVNQSTSAVIG